MNQTTMRRTLIAGNWKMNGSVAANAVLLEGIRSGAGGLAADLAVCVPSPYLAQTQSALSGSVVAWGGQDLSLHESGAYTGEVSGAMLRDFGCQFVIVGHSERRSLHGETDAIVNKKVVTALACGLKPIVCVGETLEERDAGREKEILETQLRGSLAGITPEQLLGTVIAYEPVWAIGTGRNATPEQAQDAHAHVRSVLAAISNEATAAKVRIQYGGSVKPNNATSLLTQPDIDGALVGGASLEALAFSEIVKAAV
jgi:triosephosphate isomerase